VDVTVEAGPVRFGRFPEGVDADVEALVALFRQAGVWVEASPTIRTHLWAKTLYNCALNPLGALSGVAYGALAAAPAWRLIERIVAEAFAVCAAEGVRLPWADPAAYLAYLREVQLPATAEHHSSMLQDLVGGRRTEIDFINGAVVARGAALGIDTPVNRTLTELVRFRESLLGSAPTGMD
jgi:2-dehydropantoate 2-reductase